MVYGLLQKTVMTAAPDALAKGGIAQFDKYAGGLTPSQRSAVDQWLSDLRRESSQPSAGKPDESREFGLPIDTIDVMRQGTGESVISFTAAGIGVMFLLFAVSGASGSLLDEADAGTLDRVLSTRVGMTGLLAAKWVYVTLLGMLQLTVMFVWGMIAFKLDLLKHLPGFFVMTLFTCMAAAGFGLVLATLARTRAQLVALSNIIVLVMSALGGSMFPRFLMSESMQKVGLATFNAWALDGYLKVFWRNAPIVALWPQLLVLTLLTIVFLSLARTFARRWEAA
jgi:ABC-2 type transport system permease protein